MQPKFHNFGFRRELAAIVHVEAMSPERANNQVTLPIEFRRRFNLKKGDAVVFKETDEGLLISSREVLVMKLLDDIGEGLKAKGITLDELIESGREIRQEIYDEEYVRESDD